MATLTKTGTVTIPKEEYRHLLTVQEMFQSLQMALTKHLFLEPSTRNTKRIMEGLKAHRRHSPAFLRGVERGLKESSYFSAR